MNRTIIVVAATLGSLTPLLFDSALKGAALLAVAALGALLLWRASAATRHLVWFVSVVALLIVPVLSVALPQWRVLPGWAAGPKATQGTPGIVVPTPLPEPAAAAAPVPELSEISPPSPRRWEAASATVPSVPVVPFVPAPRHWLAPAWVAGFTLLALRLLAAHLFLGRAARRCIAVAVQPPTGDEGRAKGEQTVAAMLSAACAQLGIRQRVRLLLDEKRTIPLVWGVIRPHLMLPAEARQWTDDQLRSVLLHELAHIRRRDTSVQWLTQIACALHWWNPLVWLAAWRLHVERERACDDLVLASGVRPSAYAEHLLHVATKLSPARWTSACGLAMARQSSLEGRLMAVLSDRLDRRGVTTALVAAALVLGACIAVPLAMLRAAEPDKPKADAPAVNAEPKDAKSRPLFENWKTTARSDGKIPGGRIGEMAASLKTFMDLNPGHEQSVKLEPVLKKCDASHDWTPAEAAALLDEIAEITPRAEWTMRANTERGIHPGKPLPDDLANAQWGQPAANGLRTAWLLEPRAETQPLDSVMKSRVLFHNTGKAPICFAADNWIQTGGHKAKDANGKEVSVWALERMGIRLRMVFRLAPGEFAEVEGHGLGVGSHQTSSEQSIYKVGCWIEAKAGDTVTFTPGKVPVSFQTWINNEGRKDSVTVWKEMIAARVAQESPVPAAAADREQLLRRVLQDLLGTAPTAEETAAFTADHSPDVLAKLTRTLLARAEGMHFAGDLAGGTTTFRVTAAQPKQDHEKAETAGVEQQAADPGAAKAQPQPKQGATLEPGTEEKLEWGEPVNGLRMALAWPPTLGEPAAGEVPDFYLAVQNVSAARVRLCTTAEAPHERRLTFSTNGVIQSRMVSSEPNGADARLGPREVVFLRLFTEGAKDPEKVPHGSMIASAVRQGPGVRLLADMEITGAPAGAWTGKLFTPWTRAGVGAEAPKNRKAQELFKVWLQQARVNGKIPGGHIARLGDRVKEFVRANTGDKSGDPYAKRMEPLVSRLDFARDWQPAEAAALLNDIAAVSDAPLSVMLEEAAGGTIQYSLTLKPELEKAPWGEPLPNGLRVACLFEPRVTEHQLGTPLKMRILVHNTGREPVVFRTRTWHHIEPTARDAKGTEIKMESVTRYTRPPLVAYRLMPGRFVELASPGIGIGKYGFHDFKDADIATWIGAREGDDVVLTPGPVPLSDWNEMSSLDGEPRWWPDFITARLRLANPLPADAAERTALLESTVRDLFHSEAATGEIAAFLGDREPTALESLAKRLARRPGLTPFTGSLQSGVTTFRVLPAEPDATKSPRPASKAAPAAPAAPAPQQKSLRPEGGGDAKPPGDEAANAAARPKNSSSHSADVTDSRTDLLRPSFEISDLPSPDESH